VVDPDNPANQRVQITASGNVGIGASTTPLHALDLWGTPVVNGASTEVLCVYDTRAFAAGVGGGITFGGKVDSAGTFAQKFRRHSRDQGECHRE
jgi:hypothetical protein